MTGNPGYPLAGGCDCGLVRYEVSTEALFVHCCHCRWCQRESGAAFALNALIETERLTLTDGEPVEVPVPTDSGKGQTFVRCPQCSIALWSHYAGAGRSIAFIRVGTLDEPDLMPPDIHIFTESKQPWVVLADDVPVVPRYYNRDRYWSVSSLERVSRLI